jgi:valyl-tRNA synthetase
MKTLLAYQGIGLIVEVPNKAKMDYENILKRLSNQNFISNAPEAVVLELKGKEVEHKEKITSLEIAIKNFQ